MSLKQYERYKNSGVEWLGKVPIEWEILKFRYFSTIKKGKTPNQLFDTRSETNSIPYLSMDYLRGNNEEIKWVSPSNDVQLASDQDILLLWDGSNAGEFVMGSFGAVSSTMALLSNKGMNQKYFFYTCKAAEPEVRCETVGMGIPHVNNYHLKSLPFPLPSLEEQTAIATFLDRETTKIDVFIAEQERLIQLLKEKRQAVISHAVTKGLDPNAPMKDSGVEWLGVVPRHWEAIPLKIVASYNDEALDETLNLDAEILYVDISSVDEVFGITVKEPMPLSAAPSRAQRKVRHGDVIISTVRTYLRAIARIKTPEDNLIVSTGFAVIRPKDRITPDYLGYVLFANFFIEQVIARSVGVSYPAINANELVNISITLPPTSEQTIITGFLDRETAKIDTLITESNNAIALLQERRTSLISAAVTGKIDVRYLVSQETS